jgi:photosystem II stability/assembly factor-like uncharacterized protein
MGLPISMSFVSLNEGWVLDSSLSGTVSLLQTLDGGSTWKEVFSQVARPHPVNSVVSFVNAHVGYGIGLSGDPLKSDNGGRTWSKIGSLPNTATGSVSQIVLGAALLEG